MNRQLSSILLGISIVALGAMALPLQAQAQIMPNYGAGFTSPGYIGPNPPVYGYTNYGAGFAPQNAYFPSIGSAPVFTSNYGTGFIGSPNLIYTPVNFRYGNYGAGFVPSPFPLGGLFGWL